MMLLVNVAEPPSLNKGIQADEITYGDIVRDWNIYGIQALTVHSDNKPITFLYIEKLLKADETNKYTRIFNFILIGVVTYLLFKITKRYESLVFLLIPGFVNTQWLNVEIFETIFILLSIYYSKHAGLFVGIATIFRPYAILYTILLKKEQYKYVIGIGILFALFIFSQGLFFSYLNRVLEYPTEPRLEFDYIGLAVLILFVIIGTKNKNMFKYGFVACIPLIIRTWGHYMITPYTLFLLAYLSKEENK